jgi:dihydroorotate dehydrogenase electron transfer subunit
MAKIMSIQTKNEKKSPRRGQFTARIAAQSDLRGRHKHLTLALTGEAAECFGSAKAGQFIQIACRDLTNPNALMPLLRRPFSIAAVRPDSSDKNIILVDIIYRVIGPGTNWLAHNSVGEQVDLLGPIGNGFTLNRRIPSLALLIGGGVGLPPLFFLAQQLARQDKVEIIGFAGARSVDEFAGTLSLNNYQQSEPLKPQMVIEQFSRSGAGSVIATDDGSCGFSGSVVDALQNFLDSQTGDENGPKDIQLFACGPDAMLKAIAQLAQSLSIPCQICMEAYMACGIGLCQSCVVQVRSENEKSKNNDTRPTYKLVCSNGPVFDAKTIVWD